MEREEISNYEDILRAIGQGLENLGAIAFELESVEEEFVVSGECRKTSSGSNKIRRRSFLSLIQNVSAKSPPPKTGSQTFHFSGLRFTGNDILLLNRKGRALRFSSGRGSPDPHSLSQILRMTGAYLDSTKSGLSRLSWRSPALTLWEINRAGTKTRKDFTLSEMYDIWVHQFKKRTAPAPLRSTGSD